MSLLAWNGVLWLAWGAYWLIVARRVKATKSAESFFDRVKHLAPLHIGFFLIFWWPPLFTGRQLQHAVLAWLGMALTIAGLAFAVWARLHLGGNWSGTITLKEGHELIRSGPYHFVRHPIYTGFLTALLGSALIAQSVEALIGFVIVVIALVLKLRREDKLLTQEFGDRYVAFMAEVAALVPFLY
jgi:protein-S-isoprenylcysteine O-methyltransferase Ste14